MDGGVTVITNPTVSVRMTSTISSFEVNRRFNRGITIADFKGKLELVIGTPASSMDLQLFSNTDMFLQILDDNNALLGSYPVDDDCRIHVIDRSGAQTGEFSDLSKVEKFELSDDAYEQRSESVRSFMKKKRFGQFNEEEVAKKEAELAAREAEEETAAEAIAVGNRCQVKVAGQPTKLGIVMYVGCASLLAGRVVIEAKVLEIRYNDTKHNVPFTSSREQQDICTTDFKPGYWVGLKYDEPLGKHNGIVGGRQYFECENKYGAFVRPTVVTVGDFPEEDYGLDEI